MEDPCKVQHVTRASSDELLQKFADLDSKSEHKSMEKREAKERRRCKRARTEGDRGNGESPTKNGSLVEMKSLLPPRTRRSALLRQLGIGRPGLRIREIVISRSLLKKIEKDLVGHMSRRLIQVPGDCKILKFDNGGWCDFALVFQKDESACAHVDAYSQHRREVDALCRFPVTAWHKTIEGASKMFVEKHCNQHMRLRNEAV